VVGFVVELGISESTSSSSQAFTADGVAILALSMLAVRALLSWETGSRVKLGSQRELVVKLEFELG
jgi:hypothetical protein